MGAISDRAPRKGVVRSVARTNWERTDWNLPRTLAAVYAKTRPVGDCFEWTASKNKYGYGLILRWAGGGNRTFRAYRVAYELVHGPIPVDKQLDHLCRNRACVRVEHLEAVTAKENILRGVSPSAKHARKTHCIHGHELSGDNVAVREDNGGRRCVTCRRLRMRESYRKNRVTILARQRKRRPELTEYLRQWRQRRRVQGLPVT